MSRFSDEWLRLREAADSRARAPALVRMLRRPGRSQRRRREILDLGSGSGANFRYLAPRLGARQRWRLLDHDPALLAAVTGGIRDAGIRCAVDRRGVARAACGAGWQALIGLERADLSGNWTIPAGIDLVCASALLDLVGDRILARILRRSHDAGAELLFTLSYDGRIAMSPRDELDAMVVALVNRHQRRDKGMGPALGPAAAARAARAMTALGYRVHRRRSDWLLGPEDAPLQQALIDGWTGAAAEQAPAMAKQIARWGRRRRLTLERGRSRLRVGHIDLLGLAR